MISLSYNCKCGYRSQSLNEAQVHANVSSHHITINGFLTPNIDAVTDIRKLSLSERAKIKTKELEIIRRAREKGFVR